MKLRPVMLMVIVIALLLAACAPTVTPTLRAPSSGSSGPTDTPASGATATPSRPGVTATPASPVVLRAIEALNKQLATSGEKTSSAPVEVASIEKVQWPDSCLGAEQPGEMCSMIVTDGYKITLKSGAKTYEVHTNLDGSDARVVNASSGAQPTSTSSGAKSENLPAVQAAIQALAKQIGVDAAQISVVRFEEVDWPDGCLGVDVPGRMCTMVITPGYRVILEANQEQYEVHTDRTGESVMMANAPLPQSGDVNLTWQQQSNNACWKEEISAKSVKFGTCDGPMNESIFVSIVRSRQLLELVNAYAAFSADTPAGKITLNGAGTVKPTEAEQRSVAEWARLVFQEQQAGRSGAAWGVIINWHREGGIAGFCDDLSITQDGFIQASSCKGNRPTELPLKRLSADELATFYSYMDQFASFEYLSSDQATADSMQIRLVFSSGGTQAPTDAQKQEVAAFAGKVFASKYP